MATIPLVNAVVFASYGKAKEILHKIQPVVVRNIHVHVTSHQTSTLKCIMSFMFMYVISCHVMLYHSYIRNLSIFGKFPLLVLLPVRTIHMTC